MSSKYTNIKVPVDIHREWSARAASEGIAIWQMLHKCFTFYYSAWRKKFRFEKVEGSEEHIESLNKAIWYIVKLSISVGRFKERSSQENYNMLMINIKEIEERTGINLNELRLAVEKYKKRRSKANSILINESLRDVVAKLIQFGLQGIAEKTVEKAQDTNK